MIIKEYFSVLEVSKQFMVTPRHIRQNCSKLHGKVSKELLYKDVNGFFHINHALLSKFRPVRKRIIEFSAFTLDPKLNMCDRDIHAIMQWIVDGIETSCVEVSYVIEQKASDWKSHIHGYIERSHLRQFISMAHIGFSSMQHHEFPCFHPEGWKSYMLKENKSITTIKTTLCQ